MSESIDTPKKEFVQGVRTQATKRDGGTNTVSTKPKDKARELEEERQWFEIVVKVTDILQSAQGSPERLIEQSKEAEDGFRKSWISYLTQGEVVFNEALRIGVIP